MYDEQAAFEAAIAASLADAATAKAPSSSTSKNHIPKLPPIAPAPAVFRTEAYGWPTGSGGFVRQVKIMDQWGAAFQPSIAEFSTPSAICGYVVAAVSKLLVKRFPKLVMTVAEVEDMIATLSSVDVMLPLIREEMRRLHDERTAYVASHASEFPTESKRRHYVKDWVANYELSDIVAATKNPGLHFIRHIERDDDVEHEEKRRVALEASFRDLVVFVEQGTSEGSELLRPSEWVAKRPAAKPSGGEEAKDGAADAEAGATTGGDESKSSGASGDGASDAAGDKDAARFPLLQEPCPAFITDCLGHYTTTRPVLLKQDATSPAVPTLIMFNSMGGDYTMNVCVTAAYRMMFEGAHEGSDPLFLHATHVA